MADVQPGSVWCSYDPERIPSQVIVVEVGDDGICIAEAAQIMVRETVPADVFLSEFSLEEDAQTPHEVMLEIAEIAEEIEELQDPDHWIESIEAAVDEEALRECVRQILAAGHSAGRIQTIGQKYALDQEWIEEAGKTLGLDV